jgi:hypothetical protein
MTKKIFLAVGVPVMVLLAMAGCGHDSDNSQDHAPDMSNSVPTTNQAPVTNTDLINTNLTTNHTTP